MNRFANMIIEELIIFATTPLGFIISLTLVVVLEYLYFKKVIEKDKYFTYKYFTYMKSNLINYIELRRKANLNSLDRKILDIIFKGNNADPKDISKRIGIPVNSARREIKKLID